MGFIADLIRRSLRLQVFLPLLALALVATWYGLGPSLEHFAELTGGRRFVDMQPDLTAASLIEQARGYSPETVRFYLWWSAFDFAWPLLTFTTMLFIAAWLFRFLPDKAHKLFTPLVVVAYATVLADWGENVAFVGVVLAPTPEPLALARLAIVLHAAKLSIMMVFNAGVLALLLCVIARKTVPGL